MTIATPANIHLLSLVFFWGIEIVLLIALILLSCLFFYAPHDPTETADRRFKIQVGSAFLAAAAVGGMYGILTISRALGL